MLQSANQAKRFAACCTAGRSQVFFIASITCVVSILAAALFSSFSRSQRPQGCNKGFKVGLVSWLALLAAHPIPCLDPSPKTALPPLLSRVPFLFTSHISLVNDLSYHEAQYIVIIRLNQTIFFLDFDLNLLHARSYGQN